MKLYQKKRAEHLQQKGCWALFIDCTFETIYSVSTRQWFWFEPNSVASLPVDSSLLCYFFMLYLENNNQEQFQALSSFCFHQIVPNTEQNPGTCQPELLVLCCSAPLNTQLPPALLLRYFRNVMMELFSEGGNVGGVVRWFLCFWICQMIRDLWI